MKILKRILIVILIIIAIPFVVALFVKNEYAIEKEVTINRPEAEVFGYIKHIRNQDHYSKWNMADPNMKKETRGTDGTVGFVYLWDGNNEVGAGEQEITNIEEGERIDMELRFKRPFEGTGQAHMTTEPLGENSTKVKWGMKGESSYPMNFMNLMMESTLGADLQTGLNNLKAVLEK